MLSTENLAWQHNYSKHSGLSSDFLKESCHGKKIKVNLLDNMQERNLSNPRSSPMATQKSSHSL